nr:hypothetical protein 5 [bacterium]
MKVNEQKMSVILLLIILVVMLSGVAYLVFFNKSENAKTERDLKTNPIVQTIEGDTAACFRVVVFLHPAQLAMQNDTLFVIEPKNEKQ